MPQRPVFGEGASLAIRGQGRTEVWGGGGFVVIPPSWAAQLGHSAATIYREAFDRAFEQAGPGPRSRSLRFSVN